ncbi:MAG: endonuclease/exonuclease/phosphatase family protein, partial [Actinomycetes bacterium]
GDLNEAPGQRAWTALHDGGLRDPDPASGPTFPATAPRKRIDAVLVSDEVEVVDYRVVDEPGVARASDHRPVLAVLRVPSAAGSPG